MPSRTKLSTTSAAASLWLQDGAPRPRSKLRGERQVDVAVIGAGITGITTGLLLAREGATVAILEANRIGVGVTGCNTAKVSALQGTVYSTIRSRHGNEKAAAYAEGSLAAVQRIAELAAEESIECDLRRRPALTYAADESELSSVHEEDEAARAAGLDTSVVQTVDLPYPIAGAVRLEDQIEFHPVRYVRGLADAAERGGAVIYEGSRVMSVHDGTPCEVRTSEGVVHAERVLDATHYPLLDRGLFFARLEPKRSYCIAARIRGSLPQALSISAGSPTRSIRSYGEHLILGGEGHAAGSGQATFERYRRLEEFARTHWEIEAVTHRWSAQDPIPYDHLPVIGRYSRLSSRLYVASGFMKWGLSGGTMAAMILADLLADRDNSWAGPFKPDRVSVSSAPKLVQMNAKVAVELIGDRLKPAQSGRSDEVPPGEARVVRDGLGKTGVYRDDDGAVHAVSLRCTHLGCLLGFNAAERSWDCPCHGSRFDVDGAVLEGPATQPLARREVEDSGAPNQAP